jgi:lipase maturation factor 1
MRARSAPRFFCKGEHLIITSGQGLLEQITRRLERDSPSRSLPRAQLDDARRLERDSPSRSLPRAQLDDARRLREKDTAPSTARLAHWLFLRALGLIYLIAFASFGSQLGGLIGSNGILPAADYLQWMADHAGAQRLWLAPTVFWLNAGDTALQLVCIAGAILSALLLAGFERRALLALLFVLYLSLVSVGQDFMAYQWDSLLLEAGFLALLFDSPADLGVWLFRWLLFRLMFLSGAMKLLSGDPAWRQLTALDFHFETQPLPTVFGWYAHQLPEWFHRLSGAVMFAIELGAPFLIFAGRRLRLFAAASFVFLQTFIFVTGNYTFFNLLAVALCLLLLDDAFLRRVAPQRLSTRIIESSERRQASRWNQRVLSVLTCVYVLLGGFQMLGALTGRVPEPAVAVLNWLAPFRIVNTYGLFAVMTTTRPEISVEGSNDGQTWLEYEFEYKPGDVQSPPSWAAPHQPRLDWQLWFAALGYTTEKPWLTNRLFGSNSSAAFWLAGSNVDPWFVSFVVRLLQGSPEVLALMARNPFPDAPPRYVRAQLYQYHFSDVASHTADGAWWQRELKGTYFPASSLGAH